ncbi:lipopolysaccharide biosynthesis protein [Aurantiacibacter sediminis]|uniref:Oligosaccharide flippase family protein n=1 Tax=Aurantiacibacter sediminis TaxID=2793064 RepID=A0ABS0N398_9SPHN|nr:oligosaccharide flippase family protein [Aurantiacibacter sediminis]MBH5322434.1 oligosaccharide flippase family protein [Aurantiacibacter sediminis]
MSASARSLTGQFALSGLSSGVALIANVIIGVLLARILGPEDRGAFAQVVFWATFLAGMSTFSLADAMIVQLSKERHAAADKDEKQNEADADEAVAGPEAYIPTLMISAIVVLVIAIGGAALAISLDLLRVERVEPIHVSLFVGLFFVINHINLVLAAAERAQMHFTVISVERIILPAAYLGGIVILAISGLVSLETLMVVFLVSRVPILARRLWRYRASLLGHFKTAIAKENLSIGLGLHGSHVLRFMSENIDRLFVNTIWVLAEIGYYAVAWSAAGVGYGFITQALNLIMLPMSAAKAKADRAKHLADSMRITLILSVAFAAGIVVAAPFLIPLLYGAEFAEAIVMTQILGLALLPLPIITLLNEFLRGIGHLKDAVYGQGVTLAMVVAGWLITGYDNVIELGCGLAAARLPAIAVLLLRLRKYGYASRWSDYFVPRAEDFRIIIRELGSLTKKLPRPLRSRD